MQKITILLVDDEARNLDALTAILETGGYELLRAQDADRALHLLLNHDVAAIILDIRMPGVNGIELAQIIKSTKRHREIPILFLTAHLVDDQDIISAYGAGAADYLTKPVNPQILRQKVSVFAELFRKTRALAELNDKLEERVKERTAELERSEAALREAARQKDEFLAVLAHELRNPLAPLRTGLDVILQMPGADAPPVARTLTSMNRQVDHIVRLIDDLLDVSRISSGVLALKPARVDLAELVRGSVETFRPIFEKRGVTVTVEAREGVTAVVDPVRIAQIVENLLHNASKYTAEQGKISVALTLEGSQATIRVTDDGMGIPPDQLERVFEMFARIDRQLGGGDRGAGIGLALAQRLAQMHGGTLGVASEGEGKGTTFTLTLPGAERAAVAAPRAPEGRPRARQLSVLVIEDNEDNADTMGMWLERHGHRVEIARTGPSGLELALSSRPDVVLCDIGLPGMDGVEVCRQIRARADFRPVMVALTGWGKDDDRKRTSDAGFDHHLVKPVPLSTLAELLAKAAST